MLMKMTSLLWSQLYLEHRHEMQYFADRFSFKLLNNIASYEKSRPLNKFNKQTCLNV